jgi:hypothetical protein
VDYDCRAGADYELKLFKLKWHLERARTYGAAVTELNNLLRHDSFFQIHQEIEPITLRRQVIQKCNQVGDGRFRPRFREKITQFPQRSSAICGCSHPLVRCSFADVFADSSF